MTNLFDGIAVIPTRSFIPDDDPSGMGDDFPPPQGDPSGAPPPAPDGPTCEVCGVEIPWSGRGRRPKRCQDHKTRTGSPRVSNEDGPGPRAIDKRTQARLDKVTGQLQYGLGQLCGAVAMGAPVTAVTAGLHGPGAIAALVQIAADHPRMLDGLESAAKAVPFIAVGEFVAAVTVAVAVDMGRLEPYGLVPEMLGVSEAAHKAGWQPREQQEQQSNVAGPPRSSRVAPPRFSLG